jgi:ASPIC and UnbV
MPRLGSSALADSPGRTLTIRGTEYPILLPKVRDPQPRLALVITSLQVLGQTAFDFQLSIAQILVALLTCAVPEFAIAFRGRGVVMWPASALLTGNGVAFVLRVPGTEHGRRLVQEMHAGSSYLSSEDPRAHFGLGPAKEVSEVIVHYPDGRERRLADAAANQMVAIGG